MDVFNKIKGVLFKPKLFFTGLKKEKGVKQAFIYLVILSLFVATLTFLVGLFFDNSLHQTLRDFYVQVGISPTMGLIILATVIIYAFELGISFVSAGLLHIWILIFGGKADYTKTYQLYIYKSTPSYLFAWIPIIGSIASSIWALVLLIIGTPLIHKDISQKKAILMYLIPFAILLLIYLGMFLLSSAVLAEPGFVGQAFKIL